MRLGSSDFWSRQPTLKAGKLEVRAVDWRMWTEFGDDAETIELDISPENIDDLSFSGGLLSENTLLLRFSVNRGNPLLYLQASLTS